MLLSVVFFKSSQLRLVVFLHLLKLPVFLLNLLFFFFNEGFLTLDFFRHLGPLFVLLILIRFHVRLQIRLDFLNIVNFSFLLLEHVFSLFKFLVLIAQLVYLGLELVWLLFLDHFNVAGGDFFDLGQAAVRETVTLQAYLSQCRILVQGFKHNSLDHFTEEVITKTDLTDSLVTLECIDNKN